MNGGARRQQYRDPRPQQQGAPTVAARSIEPDPSAQS
jgi:hypothetical protein